MATVLIALRFNSENGDRPQRPYNNKANRPYRPRFNPGADTATVRSVLVTIMIMATVPSSALITAKAVTVRNVLVTITIMATVLTVRATTAKVVTVRNALGMRSVQRLRL